MSSSSEQQESNTLKSQTSPVQVDGEENQLIEMLESDKIVDIAIFVSALGVVILGFCCYIVEGPLRMHLGIILFLMTGLACSLLLYKCLTSTNLQDQDENKKPQSEKLPNKKGKSD